jgi:hypothetical protein
MARKNPKTLLRQTSAELAEAKTLLKEKDRAVKNAPDKPAKASAKRSRQTAKTAVKGLEEHREILKDQTTK